MTGGTIGSRVNDNIISLQGVSPYRLIELYKSAYKADDICFDVIEPYTVMSENMSLNVYPRLMKAVKDAVDGVTKYDGIIITHGSDTLQYTAAFLYFTMRNMGLPIMLVASNYVLDDERANGLANMDAAVRFCREKGSGGVFVPYRNKDGVTYIHSGGKLLEHLTDDDDLYDYKGSVSDEIYDIPDEIEEGRVLMLFAYPSMIYPVSLLESGNVKAVIHRTYHSGTVCGVSQELKSFMEEAGKRDIKVYVPAIHGETAYESTKIYDELGMIRSDEAPISLYARLCLKYGSR